MAICHYKKVMYSINTYISSYLYLVYRNTPFFKISFFIILLILTSYILIYNIAFIFTLAIYSDLYINNKKEMLDILLKLKIKPQGKNPANPYLTKIVDFSLFIPTLLLNIIFYQ